MICVRPAGPSAQDGCAARPADLVFAGVANALNCHEEPMYELWLLLSLSLTSSETVVLYYARFVFVMFFIPHFVRLLLSRLWAVAFALLPHFRYGLESSSIACRRQGTALHNILVMQSFRP